jgi:pimeloyl-ACP methyl ester carboxylesterase
MAMQTVSSRRIRLVGCQMSQSHLHVLPGAGHAPMVTFAREVADVINDHFAESG